MKNWLVIIGILIVAVFLSACGKNRWDGDIDETKMISLDNIYGKTSLSVSDLDVIDSLLFPSSYAYQAYELSDWSISDAGSYEYETDYDHSLLLPIHNEMISREVVSSKSEDGMIYTMVNVVLWSGWVVPVLYINDLETLEYKFASVYDESKTILYTFAY